MVGRPEGMIAAEHFTFPAAIALTDQPSFLFPLRVADHVWEQSHPEEHGISARAAKAALAQAWHGVTATVDLATLSCHLKPAGPAWAEHKNGVRLRNLFIALTWDRWNAAGWTMQQRAERLAEAGLPCSARQMAAFAEQYALPRIPA